MRLRIVTIICGLLLVSRLSAAEREAVPDAARQAKAQSQIDERFGTDLSKQPAAQQAEAAGKMLAAVGDKQNDSATRYVLLKDAHDLACSSGAAEIAIPAAQRLAELYDLDGSGLRLQTLLKVISTASTAKSDEAIAGEAALLADQFADADDWRLLGRLATIAEAAAMDSNSSDLLQKTRQHFEQLHILHLESTRFRTAQAAAEKDPADPTANLNFGALLCLVKADWDKGLPKMAAGADAGFKDVLARDTKAPADSAARAELADAWWKLASSEPDSVGIVSESRAAYWYKLAIPDASAQAKPQMQQRMEAARKDSDLFAMSADSIARTHALVRAGSARAMIDSAQTMAFPKTVITADMTIDPGDMPYEIQEKLQITGTLTIHAGTQIIGGTIELGTKGHVVATGDLAKPVIFRHVTFSQDLGGSLKANDAVFDDCRFQKGGVWYSYASSKWTFDRCLLYKCQFAKLTGVDYGFHVSHCALVSMDFPEIDHKDRKLDHLRVEWNKIDHCDFLDCAVPPTVLWCSESSNFTGCQFISGKVAFTGDQPWKIEAHIVDSIDSTPQQPWDDAAKKQIEFIEPGTAFDGYSFAAQSPVPEIIVGNSIRVIPAHLRKLPQ